MKINVKVNSTFLLMPDGEKLKFSFHKSVSSRKKESNKPLSESSLEPEQYPNASYNKYCAQSQASFSNPQSTSD